MNIAISCLGDSLDSKIDSRFGRCQKFLILTEDGQLKKTISNQGAQAARGAGVQAAQNIVNEEAELLLTGNIGPNAFNILSQNGVDVYLTPAGITASEALEKYNSGKLQKAQAATGPPRRGGGRGAGRGQGRGRGRSPRKNN